VSDEVQNLEATNAELCDEVQKLEAKHEELLEAATNAVWWWDGGNPISPKASDVMGRLRAAIAKAKERRYD
jgi:hypothetical protein